MGLLQGRSDETPTQVGGRLTRALDAEAQLSFRRLFLDAGRCLDAHLTPSRITGK